MSIASNDGKQSPRHAPASDDTDKISERKARHLEICVDSERYTVETGDTGFYGVRFLHRSLPEVNEPEVDTRVRFLDHELSTPLLISCMTGGSVEGTLINRRLAEAAQQAGIAVGMGSIRILFRDESYLEQFRMKRVAPDVPVIANLSAVQVREIDHRRIFEMLKRLEVQALAIHLNAGQELFQPKGDRDFRGLREAIARFCQSSPLPVIVKETGFGIRPSEIDFLLSAGARYVDLAGAGGTNWVRVESYRVTEATARIAREFDDWGIPTAVILAALRARSSAAGHLSARGLIASGGLRSGVEVAKALALGAELAGMALPFARAVHANGVEGVLAQVEEINLGLRSAMTLTGSSSLEGLRAQRLTIDEGLRAQAEALIAADCPSAVTRDA